MGPHSSVQHQKTHGEVTLPSRQDKDQAYLQSTGQTPLWHCLQSEKPLLAQRIGGKSRLEATRGSE